MGNLTGYNSFGNQDAVLIENQAECGGPRLTQYWDPEQSPQLVLRLKEIYNGLTALHTKSMRRIANVKRRFLPT